MSAKSGKVFFTACAHRDAALGLPFNKECGIYGAWPEWAKRAYFSAYQSAYIGLIGKAKS